MDRVERVTEVASITLDKASLAMHSVRESSYSVRVHESFVVSNLNIIGKDSAWGSRRQLSMDLYFDSLAEAKSYFLQLSSIADKALIDLCQKQEEA